MNLPRRQRDAGVPGGRPATTQPSICPASFHVALGGIGGFEENETSERGQTDNAQEHRQTGIVNPVAHKANRELLNGWRKDEAVPDRVFQASATSATDAGWEESQEENS